MSLKINEIPVCISADNKNLEVLLFDVAKSISNTSAKTVWPVQYKYKTIIKQK